ncbi:MAG: hypothetical protein ACREYB_03975 [Casimicrobiaceae bacterium]
MPLRDDIRLRAELRAATVLLHALIARQNDVDDVRTVFESAVVRETAHLLERGVRSDVIRAFENAAGHWTVRARMMFRQSGQAPAA